MAGYDYLIVGSGLYGSVIARLATDAGKRCLVVEKRNHIGGNLYCEDIDGINVHKYGAHIFHTSNKEVWKFVNRYVDFNRYTNCPVAKAPNRNLYNLPFNMNTFYQMWGVETPEDASAKLEEQREEVKARMKSEGIEEPRNLEEQALLLIGKDIYEQLIKHYTEKQWGRRCSELPASIIKRLPVRLTFDNNYFNDLWQGIPIGGYNVLIEKLLEGTDVKTGCDYFDNKEELDSLAEKVIYTGPIDRYFDYCLGRLEWRTVRFETEILTMPNYQGNAVVNYTGADHPFTRIIEHKHFEMFGNEVYENPKTVISREYSVAWEPGMEAYYPVNDTKNQKLYEEYKEMAEHKASKVWFGGRLGTYSYLDMDKVIARAIEDWKKF